MGAENPKHLVNLPHSTCHNGGGGRSETAEYKAGQTLIGGEVQLGFFEKINKITNL